MSAPAFSSRDVARAAKLRGFTLHAKAVRPIVRLLREEEDPRAAVGLILDAVKQHVDANPGSSRIVDEATIESVIADLSKDETDLDHERFQLLNAFDTPKLHFDPARKRFSLTNVAPGALHGGAQGKVGMLRERFLLVQQRLLCNDAFCRPMLASAADQAFVELTSIDALLGSPREVKRLVGMLCEVEEGRYFLEDLHAQVPLELSNAATAQGLCTENCIVLVEGELVDGLFHVHVLGFPPPQQRVDALATTGHLDLFCTGVTPQQWAHMQQRESHAGDAMFVIVSDVHLDRPHVLDKLRRMFEGFAQVEPLPLFVLIGDFSSHSVGHGKDGIQQQLAHFKALADVIASFPTLASEGRFVFVPGPTDPGAGNTLPRAPLSSKFARVLQDQVAHAKFATNPCRLRFYAQEIVIFRDDILKKMQRHCIFPPQDADIDTSEHLVATVLDQAHLCPLPLVSRPIHWAFDHALRLYPLPDVVVLADHSDQYQWRYEDCLAMNPGSFPADGSFVVYRPSTFETEFSRV